MRSLRRILLTLVLASGLWAAPAAAQEGTPLKVVGYRVQPGDTISGISEYFYNDRGRTEWIAQHNRLANANRISVGQRLDIPFYDMETWQAYAGRTGQPGDAASMGGGSQDVAVTSLGDYKRRNRRFWAIVIYGSLAFVLTTILYIRSRRQEDTALGVGVPRR